MSATLRAGASIVAKAPLFWGVVEVAGVVGVRGCEREREGEMGGNF